MGKEYRFSGHESFQCKSLWLKKGYDFVQSGQSFNSENAVVEMGVGKNMVSAIRYWLRAFDILSENDLPTIFGKSIIGDTGFDPYIEDISTLWLLHYHLIEKKYAYLYHILFVEFHKTRKEFQKGQLQTFLQRKLSDILIRGFAFNENTVSKDIDTLLKNYVEPQMRTNYEDFLTLLLPLNLIYRVDKNTFAFNEWSHASLSPFVFLYAVKRSAGTDKVVEFDKILELSRIFCLGSDELYDIFEKLHQWNSAISFDNAAGEQLFTMNCELTTNEILTNIYANPNKDEIYNFDKH